MRKSSAQRPSKSRLTLSGEEPDIYQRRVYLRTLDGEPCIVWGLIVDSVPPDEPYHWGQPCDTISLLDQFISLANESESEDPTRDVFKFARQFGPLKAVVHQHKDPEKIDWYSEPVSVYEKYARRLKGILRIDYQLRHNRLASPDDWRDLHPLREPINWSDWNDTDKIRRDQRAILSWFVTGLLRKAPIYPTAHWDANDVLRLSLHDYEQSIDTELHGFFTNYAFSTMEENPLWWTHTTGGYAEYDNVPGTLYLTIMLHLLRRLNGKNAICSECGNSFEVNDNRGRWHENQYCPRCSVIAKKSMDSLRQKRHRAKEAGVKNEEGASS